MKRIPKKARQRRRNGTATFLLEALECRQLLTAVVAASADAFVNSIGINTHDVSQANINNLLIPLGIRHIRESSLGDTALQSRLMNLYLAHGVRVDEIANSGWTISTALSIANEPYVESMEAYNEADGGSGYTYTNSSGQKFQDSPSHHTFAATEAFYSDFYAAKNADTFTVSKPMLSPSLANTVNAQYFQGTPFDVENVHHYTWAAPETGVTSAINDTRWEEASGDPNVPVVVTEAGYFTYSSTWDPSGNQSGTDDATQAKYLPRLLANNFNDGVQTTYLYDLIDDPVTGTESQENHFGIVNNNGTVKPAYTDIQNMISLLSDSTWSTATDTWDTPSFTPGSLDYTIEGNTSNVDQLLLEKSDGTYYLLLWQDVSSYNFSTQQDIANPTVPITLNLNTPIAEAQTFLLNSTTPTATYSSNLQSLTVNVPDQIMIVELTPGSAPTTTDPTVTIGATTPTTDENASGTPGVFTVTRTGSTASALTVNYTVGGTATSGKDYNALSGSVVIPAGSATAVINVTPINDALPEVNETVTVNLADSSSYTLGANWNDAVTIINDDAIDNFESGTLSGWSDQNSSISTLALTTTDVASGNDALKWTFHDTAQWGNQIQMTFSAQDWSNAAAVQISFAVDPASIGDAGKTIYFNYYNNGASPTGSSAEDSFHIEPTSAYQTVTLSLGAFTRNAVNEIAFYVDGTTYTSGSTQSFYIDNITLIPQTSINASPPAVQSFVVNDGAAQRSMVTSLTLSFNQPVNLNNAVSLLLKQSDGSSVPVTNYTLTPSTIGMYAATYTLTFTGDGNSLADGVYDLQIDGNAVTNAAGEVLGATTVDYGFFRLFGDYDGNGTVNNADYLHFKNAFDTTSGDANYASLFDYDGNGVINNYDYLQFKARFGVVLSL